MSTNPNPSFIDTLIADQVARRPAATDRNPLLSRYLFCPFNDHDLTMLQWGQYGLTVFKQGYIYPITRFQHPDVDYAEVKRVPTNRDGSYQPSDFGVSTTTLKDRVPATVVAAIFRVFNPHHGTSPQEDNGICEIPALLGNEDMVLYKQLQTTLLPDPERFTTARGQLEQLNQSLERARNESDLFTSVCETMIAATETSVVYAKWHYHRLQGYMENRARSGKEELAPLDVRVCQWIEQPEPRFRSQLVGEAQPVIIQQPAPVQPAGPPTIQHKRCGAFLNLVDGQPPEVCFVCGSPFIEPAQDRPTIDSGSTQAKAPKGPQKVEG